MYLKLRKGSGMIQFGWKSVCLPYTYTQEVETVRNTRDTQGLGYLRKKNSLNYVTPSLNKQTKTKPEPLTNNSAKEDLGNSSVEEYVFSVP